MLEALNILDNKSVATLSSSIALIITGIAYIVIFREFFKRYIDGPRQKRNDSEKIFFSTLKEGLKSQSINTLDDVINLYMGVFKLSEGLNRYGLSKMLRRFLVEIISNKDKDDLLDYKAIVEWKKMITDYIKTNEELSPFADLPSAERNILSDISIFIEKNDIDSAKRKFSELAGMIQARNDDMTKIRDMNKWSVPLSIVGSILTLVFGVIALFN